MNDDVLFGPLEPHRCYDLTAFGIGLFEAHLRGDPAHFQQAVRDLSHFRGPLDEFRNHRRDDLWRTREALKGRLLKAPLAAMLAEESRSDDLKIRLAGNVLTAWVLAAVLRRMRRDPAEAAIVEAQKAVRLLKRVSPTILRDFATAPKTMEEVRRSVIGLLDDQSIANNVRGYLERIRYIFEAVLKDRAAIFRQTRRREGGEHGGRPEEAKPYLPPNLIRAHDGNLDWLGPGQNDGLQEPDLVGPLEEQAAEEVSGTIYAIGRPNPRHMAPRRIAKRKLSQMVKALGKRQLALGADTGSMSAFEVSHLVRYCIGHLDRGGFSLLAQLIYGQALRLRSDRSFALEERGGRLMLRVDLDLPAFEDVLEEEDPLVHDNAGCLYLALPLADARIDLNGAASTSRTDADEALVDQHLQAARVGVTRAYRLGRIARYKADWLKRQGCDAAIVGFLTGDTPSHRAQLHYSQIPKSTLVYWHRKYLHDALGLYNPRFAEAGGLHGSHLKLSSRGIRAVFEGQRSQFVQWRRQPEDDFGSIAARHNAFTTYCLMLLYFATGHRPVGHPFERLGDMDLQSGLIWISDKTSTANRGARMLILPQTAQQQLQFWCAHLRRLHHVIATHHQPLISARIEAALTPISQDQAPLFFYLDVNDSILESSVAVQRKALQEILPTALNWSRHVLRSALISRVSGELIDAWMGHAHYGESPFKKSSGLSLGDLRHVADEIDQILAAHQVRAELGVL